MRVLYFSPRLTPHDHRFLTALSGTDYQIYTLQTESRERDLEAYPLPANVVRIPWPEKKDGKRHSFPAARRIIRRIVDEVNPDVVHAGPLHETAFLCALARVRPLVSMSWGSDILWQAVRDAMTRWMIGYTLKRTAVFTGDCRAVADEAARYGFAREKMVLFPWGVDLRHFTPQGPNDIRQQLGWQDKFVVLSLRSWEPIYGVEHLVQGFSAAAHRNPALRLLLLGGGSQAALIRGLVLESGIQDRVHFGGRVAPHNLPNFYRAADLYASASFSDGSSVSLLEALACGLPALVSDIPGNREWVEPGRQGWLFPVGDAAEIQRAILSACEQRADLPAMGEQARVTAEERADWNRNFPKLLDAYQMALAG